ncbi:hypothetical protein CDIK_0756 [Cucumispora dikerogammari]|nr:hypothetical protein CDIK_0756 [Cucumispora dikerogammari]
MSILNALSYSHIFEEQSEVDFDGIEKDVFREINLYRAMLGLTQATEKTDLYLFANAFNNERIEKSKVKMRKQSEMPNKKLEVAVQNNTSKPEFNINVYTGNKYNYLNIGIDIVQAWQKDDIDNATLILPNQQYVGFSAGVGLCPSKTKPDKNLPKGRYLYATRYSSSCIQEIKVAKEIQISLEMMQHFTNYIQYFCYHLNRFMLGNFYFHGCILKKIIENDIWLNQIATEHLITAIENRDAEATTQELIRAKISKSDKKFNSIEILVLRFNTYIPAVRLLHNQESISEKIKSEIVSGKKRNFGMSVVLRKDKSFHVLIILSEPKKTFFQTLKESVSRVFY